MISFPEYWGNLSLVMAARDVTRLIKQTEIVDITTGESVKTTTESILNKEPDFVKLYLRDIAMLNGLPNASNNVLYELLKMMDYRNRIVLNSAIKKEIASELRITVKTIDNALNILLKEQILIRKGTGLFVANPLLFGKGEWREIRELRMTVFYTKEGREIKTEVVKEQQRDLATATAFTTIAACLSTAIFCAYQVVI